MCLNLRTKQDSLSCDSGAYLLSSSSSSSSPFDALDSNGIFIVPFPFSQNQAKLFIEQKKIPFPVDNQNINEELGKLALYLKSKSQLQRRDAHVLFASQL